MDAQPRDLAALGEFPGQATPLPSPGRSPVRSFTVTGRPLARAAARATATARSGSSSSAAPAPGLADLRHGAAHVDVDQVGAGLRDALGRRGHHVGIGAEQLDRHRVLVRMDAQQLGAGALVAVVDGVARHHLRDRQAGAVALGLEPHEPVADAGQRRQHDPVRDRDATERPRVCQRPLHPDHGTNQVMDTETLIAPWLQVIRDQVPGLELFDAHTHLGEHDPDGMRQSPEELLHELHAADARGCFVFPMHEPDGYPPANDFVIDVAAGSDGLFVPFCRVKPGDGALAEAERALARGAKGIKLHPRAEQFTLDHPDVPELFALAERAHGSRS